MGDVVSATGGSVAGLAIYGWGEQAAADFDGTTAVLGILGVVGIAIAYAVLARGPLIHRPAAIALLIGSVICLANGLVRSGSNVSPGTAAILLFLYAAAYIAPFSRGRPAVLGAGLLSLWLLTGTLFDGQINPNGTASGSTLSVVLMLLLALLLLVVALRLELMALPGPATPFFAVGNLAAALASLTIGVGIFGRLSVSGDNPEVVPAFLMVVVGFVLVIAGSFAARRLTMWHGAVTLWLGSLALIGAMFQSSSGIAGPVIVLLVIAGALVALTQVVEGWSSSIEDRIVGVLGPDAR